MGASVLISGTWYNTLLEIPTAKLRTGWQLHETRAKVYRFWPRKRLPAYSPDEAAASVLAWTTRAVQKIAEKHPVRLALTAGLDSRVMLAVLLKSGIDFEPIPTEAARAQPGISQSLLIWLG
jgi:hypothetical protein